MKWNKPRGKREWRLTTLKLCAFPSFGLFYATRYFSSQIFDQITHCLYVSIGLHLFGEGENNGQEGTCKADKKRSHHRRRVVEDEINDETIFMFFIRKHSRWFRVRERRTEVTRGRAPSSCSTLLDDSLALLCDQEFLPFQTTKLIFFCSDIFHIFFNWNLLFIITLTLLCYTRSFDSI